MNATRIKTLYTRRARIYHDWFVRGLGWDRELQRFFGERDILRPGLRIVDAGCGTGIVTRTLYQLSKQRALPDIRFDAFDLTPAMLDIFRDWVREQQTDHIHLQEANVLHVPEELPEDWRGYDLLVSAAMLEYIPQVDLGTAIANLGRLLGPQGALLLFLTRRNALTSWIGRLWWKTNTFDRAEITGLLSKAGFSKIESHLLSPLWRSSIMTVEAKR